MLYKWFNGLFLYQLEPSFFYTRQDLFTWLFMQTGMHQWLLNNKPGWILFDTLFYSMPLIYFLSLKYLKKASLAIVLCMIIVNWCYVQCYTLYPSNSIEGHIAWLLFPLVFLGNSDKIFSLLFEGLRYFFIFLFASSGVWKLAQGGAFSPAEMSGILLYQHNQLLTNSPGYWQSGLFLWLIQRPPLAYLLYLSATLLELFFIVGFFTKKIDRQLFLLFLLFLVMDYFIMRITYFEVSTLLLTLLMKPVRENTIEHGLHR